MYLVWRKVENQIDVKSNVGCYKISRVCKLIRFGFAGYSVQKCYLRLLAEHKQCTRTHLGGWGMGGGVRGQWGWGIGGLMWQSEQTTQVEFHGSLNNMELSHQQDESLYRSTNNREKTEKDQKNNSEKKENTGQVSKQNGAFSPTGRLAQSLKTTWNTSTNCIKM